MRKTVSIQDIAREARVSHTTVSRALRDSSLISLEVRDHIQKLASEMGYIPNAVAQSLRGQRTQTVGLVVTSIADPFVGRVVRGIEEAAQQVHLSLLLSVSNNDPDREVQLIETFYRRRVDGIIVTASRLTDQHEKHVVKIGIPTVIINPQSPDRLERLPSVSVDDDAGMRAVASHLVALGHRKIGYIGAGNRPRSNQRRINAFRGVLLEAGINPRDDWFRIAPQEHRFHSDDVVDGQTFLPELVEAGVTAVCCFNDMIASGALLACHSLGIQVPEQLSLTGFDDIELAQLVSPTLTTVHQPKLRLGQMAMEMLVDLLEGRPVENHILETDLTVRGSTGSAPDEAPGKQLKANSRLKRAEFFSPR